MSQLGADQHYTLQEQIASALFVALPQTLGLFSSCYVGQIAHVPPLQAQAQACYTLQQTYGLAYVFLFLASLIGGIVALFRYRVVLLKKRFNANQSDKQGDGPQRMTHLCLLFAGALTLVVFAKNPSSVFTGQLGVRYIICLLVSLPAVLYPLWYVIQKHSYRWRITSGLLTVTSSVLLICLVLLASEANVALVQSTVQQRPSQQQTFFALEGRLNQMHITRFYSEYWTCFPLIMLSHEKLVCGDTWESNGTIIHGFDRYAPYRAMVEASDNPAYVYPDGFLQIQDLEKALKETGTPYIHASIDHYEIYQPLHPIPSMKL
jgi:hypothetical protein